MLVQTKSLGKTYGSFAALADCSLSVPAGEVFGLLGPNGAGKTTLLRILMGFLRPTSGTATIDGLDCYSQQVQVHRRVAYLPGDARLFRGMRGRDVLKFFAGVRPESDYDRAVGLARRLDLDLSRRVGFMSTGMRQKLAIAATLSADVPMVILDEPTANLDPTVRGEVTRLVNEAKSAGRTVLFSSHVLSEVEDTCDRVVILRAGRLVHTQVMSELRRSHRIHADLKGAMPEVPPELEGQITVQRHDQQRLTIETPFELAPLMRWIAGLPLEEIRIEPIGLRAVYDRYHSEIESNSSDKTVVEPSKSKQRPLTMARADHS